MSGLGKKLKKTVKNSFTLNPITKIKRDVNDAKGKLDKVGNYFKKPKFDEPVPPEMADEEAVSRANNRDLIRRRRSGGRSSTIMSDSLG